MTLVQATSILQLLQRIQHKLPQLHIQDVLQCLNSHKDRGFPPSGLQWKDVVDALLYPFPELSHPSGYAPHIQLAITIGKVVANTYTTEEVTYRLRQQALADCDVLLYSMP